ncbi:ATP-binding protein [Streptomyces sp. NPDC090108]|uniref:ATP-binding protein n=1 Tax=Streptomyces sp. NPDC090108 TaxID=3365947 RepID=UPI0037FE51EA
MCAETRDDAVLVVSELVTNVVVHTASSRVVCELRDQDGTVRVAVLDEGCASDAPHPYPRRPDEEHGRGLLLVGTLCRAWGAHEHGTGLLVWADLPHRTAAARGTGELPGGPAAYGEAGEHGTVGGAGRSAAPGAPGVRPAADDLGCRDDLGWGTRPKPGPTGDQDESVPPKPRNGAEPEPVRVPRQGTEPGRVAEPGRHPAEREHG